MHPLALKIASLQRRLVRRQRAAAACWTAAAVLTAVIVLGIIDYVVRFADPGVRIMATVTLATVITWAVYRWWYLPTRQGLLPLAVARRVESHFPELHDSLASALEFLQQSEDDLAAGSAQLRRLVVSQAHVAVERLPLDQVIDYQPLRRALRWLAVPAAVLLLCLAWDANAVGTAMLRLLAPLGSAEWPRAHHLAFRDPPTRIAAGQTFEVELVNTAGPLPDEVRIEYRGESEGRRESTSEPMSRVGDIMVARRENVRQSFAFRAVGGDDHSMPWQWVEVIDPPRLVEFSIVVHPPAYTGLPAMAAQRHLEVLAGSGLEIRGTASEPLSAAQIVMDGAPPISAAIRADSAGHARQAFHIGADDWIARTSGRYRVELVDAEGVSGVAGQWNLQVMPDPPPSVSWQQPAADLYVTASAVVPLDILVQDNLAIERVELVYEGGGRPVATVARQAAKSRIDLYRGPERAAPSSGDATASREETRIVTYDWDVAPLALPVGTTWTCHVEAADYRPGTGRTADHRRITIITRDELDARLADWQTQIVRQLERALAAQRATREEVRRLEIQQQNVGALTGGDRLTIQSAELNQRRVGQMLVDPRAGLSASVRSALSEIAINKVSNIEPRASLERLLGELGRLASGPLNAAELELVAARKAFDGFTARGDADSGDESAPTIAAESHQLAGVIARAGAAQEEVIGSLERLLSELSGRANFRRLIQQLADLRRDQLAFEQTSRAEIGLETLPLQLGELTRTQRDKLNKAAAEQIAIATRFEKIVRSLDRLSQQRSAYDEEKVASAAYAVDLANRMAIAANMHEASRDFSQNRVGQAFTRASQFADDLRQVLDALRDANDQRPDQVVEQLRQSEARLAALRDQAARLRAQVAQAETQGDAAVGSPRLEQLHNDQEALQRAAERLAGRLERLQAADASQSTRNAANRLQGSPSNDDARAAGTRRPAPSSELRQAEQDLEQAARQLAAHRQQAEDQTALELVHRLHADLEKMVERQKQVIHDTVQVQVARKPNGPLGEASAQDIVRLAGEERDLANRAGKHHELLPGLDAVRLGLEEARRRLTAAAEQLEANDAGPSTQQAERHALAQLEGMLQTFAQTASESSQNPPAATATDPADRPPQRRPTLELLEVKMLRFLQVDLHERTRALQDRLAELTQPPHDRERVALTREARELQADQRRLAELVQGMLVRHNGKDNN